jgi:hypothetical protein
MPIDIRGMAGLLQEKLYACHTDEARFGTLPPNRAFT